MNLFVFLIVSGFILFLLEIFVPGGVLGIIGFLFLLGSAIIAFRIFGIKTGIYYSFGMLLLLTIMVIIVTSFTKYIPFREKIFLAGSLKDNRIENLDIKGLLNKKGIAYTVLRPVGKVKIEDRLYDGISESGFIEKGSQIYIISIDNNNLIVRKV